MADDRNILVRWLSDTKDLKKGNKDAVKNTTESVSKIDKSFAKAAKTIGTFLTAAAAFQVMRDAVQTIKDFETNLKGLSSITGLQGKALEDLGVKAVEMSGRFGTSASDILDGFSLVGSAIPELLKAPDALAEVTKQADILSKASGLTLQEAIGALTKSMNQFGVGAEDAALFTDILATSQQKGTARVTALSEALKNSGSIAKAAGLDFQQTNVLLQALAKGGLEGAEAGTKLRGIISRLASSGRKELNPAYTDMNKILETLGKEITDVEKATKFFGEQNAAAALTLINQKDVVEELTGALSENGNALAQATVNTDTLNGMLQRTAALWDAFILSIDSGEGVISKMAKRTVAAFNGILGALTAINDGSAEFSSNFSDIFNDIGRANARLNQARDAFKSFVGDRESVTGLEKEIDLLKAREELAQQLLNAELTGNSATENEQERLANIAFARKEIAAAQAQRAQAQSQLNFLLGTEKEITEEILDTQTKLSEKELKARQKAAEERAKIEAEAEKKIQDLRLSLLEDGFEKERAALILDAQRKIEAAKGTEEQIAQQRFLITANTLKAIQKLEKDQLEERAKAESELRKMIAEDDAEREAKLLDDLILGFERNRQDAIIGIKQDRLDGEFETEADYQKALRDLEIKAIEDRLASGVDELDERRRLQEQLLDLKQEEQDEITRIEQQGQEDRRQLIQNFANLVSTIGEAVFQGEIDRIDEAIERQKKRVEDVTRIADKGNAEQLQLEEERLAKLNKAKEAAVKKQRQIAAVEIGVNAALAVSRAIPAIIAGFKTGNLVQGIGTAVALAATVASSVLAIRNTLSSVPAFATGTEYVHGFGSGTNDKINARLSKGERVVPANENAKLKGIPNSKLAQYAIAGKRLHNGTIGNRAYSSGNNYVADNSGVERRLESVENAINSLELTTRTNGKQIETVLSKRNAMKKRRENRLK